MKYSVIFSALLALMVQGCSTMDNGVKAQILGANIDIAKQRAQAAAKPVLDAKIPVPGCKAPEGADYKTACVMTIVVHAPQGATSGQLSMPDDPMWRVLDRGMGVLGTAAGIYLGGDAAVGLVSAAGSGIVNALKVQPAPTVVNQPAPVIVPAAEPIIVNQPAPVVVPAPDPVIVDPVVVQPEIVYVPTAP